VYLVCIRIPLHCISLSVAVIALSVFFFLIYCHMRIGIGKYFSGNSQNSIYRLDYIIPNS